MIDYSDLDAIVRDPEAYGFRSWVSADEPPAPPALLTCTDRPVIAIGRGGYSFVVGWVNRWWTWSLRVPIGTDSCEAPT